MYQLEETINICAEAFLDNPGSHFPEDVFAELMHSATSTVEFSFDNVIYKQVKGVAMGSPLGPVMINSFVGYQGEKLISEITKPAVYSKYGDNNFYAVSKQKRVQRISDQTQWYSFFSQIHFLEKKRTNIFIFSTFYVEHIKAGYETTVCCKPAFISQYICWKSFILAKLKTTLISILVHRARMICSRNKLKEEIH